MLSLNRLLAAGQSFTDSMKFAADAYLVASLSIGLLTPGRICGLHPNVTATSPHLGLDTYGKLVLVPKWVKAE